MQKSRALVVLLASLAVYAGTSCDRDPHGRVVVAQGECYTCHQAEYEATTLPPHVGLYSTECAMCHNEINWGDFLHTWFPLQNRHAPPVPCIACHTVGFALGNTPTTCVGCHQTNYAATTLPQHVLSGGVISADCATCHSDAGWIPSTFVHAWPLTGVHASPTPNLCARCHGDPRPAPTPPWAPTYTGTPTTCFACHEADKGRGNTVLAGHSGYPDTCGSCHDTVDWGNAVGGSHPETCFNIASGPHAPFSCIDCHDPALGSPALGMNTDCVSCHSDAARDHTGVGAYPATPPTAHFCLDCHATGRSARVMRTCTP